MIQNLSGEYLNPRTQVMQGQAYIAKKKRGYHNTTKSVSFEVRYSCQVKQSGKGRPTIFHLEDIREFLKEVSGEIGRAPDYYREMWFEST